MNGGDFFTLFWFILLFLFLFPQFKLHMLKNARLKLIRQIEKKKGCRIITLIHRQEQLGLFGIPFYRYIDIEDSEQVLRAIRTTPPDTSIGIVIHTPGGLVLAATQIALALKDHPAKTTVIVPHYAMSGGTLIALAADEILMDPHAVLGPIDPQLSDPQMGVIPAASVLRAVREKGKEKVDDLTLIRADVAEKAIRQLKELVVELTKDKLGLEKAEKLAEMLTTGQWTHDYPLTAKRLIELGIPVKTEIPREVYMLMELYPQPAQKRPDVEFIPHPPISPRPEKPGQRQAKE